jgi:aminomuconate-semialdehyde/2-hydroxymuconate-6-semialdehyde dehydrogenase
VVTGGGVPTFGDERDSGAFVQPTIWTGLPTAPVACAKNVRPGLSHRALRREDEVIGRVNDSAIRPGGLRVDQQAVARAPRRAPIPCRLVWINSWFSRDLRTPFGGSKLSGIGREGGRYSLDFYSETTNICVAV